MALEQPIVFLGQGKLECAARFDRSIGSPHVSVHAKRREECQVPWERRIRALHELVNFKGWPLFVVSCVVSLSFPLFLSRLGLADMCLRDRYFYHAFSNLAAEISRIFGPIDCVSCIATLSCALLAYRPIQTDFLPKYRKFAFSQFSSRRKTLDVNTMKIIDEDLNKEEINRETSVK